MSGSATGAALMLAGMVVLAYLLQVAGGFDAAMAVLEALSGLPPSALIPTIAPVGSRASRLRPAGPMAAPTRLGAARLRHQGVPPPWCRSPEPGGVS